MVCIFYTIDVAFITCARIVKVTNLLEERQI